jgi:hypothetical protein
MSGLALNSHKANHVIDLVAHPLSEGIGHTGINVFRFDVGIFKNEDFCQKIGSIGIGHYRSIARDGNFHSRRKMTDVDVSMLYGIEFQRNKLHWISPGADESDMIVSQ